MSRQPMYLAPGDTFRLYYENEPYDWMPGKAVIIWPEDVDAMTAALREQPEEEPNEAHD